MLSSTEKLTLEATIARELLNEIYVEVTRLCLEGADLHGALVLVLSQYSNQIRNNELNLMKFDRLPKD